MEVENPWAYINQAGREWVSAVHEKNARIPFGGKSLGRTYWSRHRSGSRWPMKLVVLKTGTAFFAYKSDADAAKGGSGESFSHRLFKDALSQLTKTRLKLGPFGDHEITIIDGAVEKEIVTDHGSYYADAYFRFSSTTPLGLRWDGELYVEVHHKHEVPVEKEQQLRELGLPVIEVRLPDFFLYRDGSEADVERERAHVAWTRKVLEGDNGYLAGTVISDRLSKRYLEARVQALEDELNAAERDRQSLKLGLRAAAAELKRSKETLETEVREASRARSEADAMRRRLTEARKELSETADALIAERTEAANAKARAAEYRNELLTLKKKVRVYLSIAGITLLAAAGTLVAFWL